MKRTAHFSLAALLGLYLLAQPQRAWTAAPEDNQDKALANLQDPGFDRFVDLKLFRDALGTQNAAALCDVALQLAEGERVLLRSYNGLPAHRVFKLAITVAAERKDKPTLDRLEKALTGSKMRNADELLEVLTLARSSRRPQPPPPGGSAEAILVFRSYQNDISTARSVADRKELDRLEQAINGVSDMSDKHRGILLSQIKEARGSTQGEKEDGDDFLRQLASAARSNDRAGREAELRGKCRAILFGTESLNKGGDLAELEKLSSKPVTRNDFEAQGKKLGLDVAELLTGQNYDKERDELVCGVLTFNVWETTGVGAARKRVALPPRYVPYFGIQRK